MPQCVPFAPSFGRQEALGSLTDVAKTAVGGAGQRRQGLGGQSRAVLRGGPPPLPKGSASRVAWLCLVVPSRGSRKCAAPAPGTPAGNTCRVTTRCRSGTLVTGWPWRFLGPDREGGLHPQAAGGDATRTQCWSQARRPSSCSHVWLCCRRWPGLLPTAAPRAPPRPCGRGGAVGGRHVCFAWVLPGPRPRPEIREWGWLGSRTGGL